ncbi:DoxX family protein [Kitasatospora sp. NPDC097605]|uniref:DoxX family protein n=1 Tax=Kitasatospora sp. NPDC097605 TaxID=3157226 RepID=UPI00331AEFB6
MESFPARMVRSSRRRADSFARAYRRVAPGVLRISVGVLYLWFGLPKFFPGASPAEDLATRCMSLMTFDAVPPDVSRFLLALMEVGIGLGLVTGVLLRVVLAVFFVHMTGVFATLVLLPNDVWTHGVPPVPTLEGQYILKNIVLVVACLTVATRERRLPRPASSESAPEPGLAPEPGPAVSGGAPLPTAAAPALPPDTVPRPRTPGDLRGQFAG